MVSDRNITTDIPATVSRRIAAFAYDILLVLAILFVATAVALIFSQAVSGSADMYKQYPTTFRAYLAVCIFLFFGWFWTHGGQTLGMRAWKIQLQTEKGYPVSWPQALTRFVLGILTFGIGLVWINISQNRQALYDQLARTRVIMVEAKHIPKISR